MSGHSVDKLRAVKVITECAVKYKNNLLNCSLLFLCMDKNKNTTTVEVIFKASSYMHLTGCKPVAHVASDADGNMTVVKPKLSATDFFWQCADGKISADDFEFSDDGTAFLKLEVLPCLMEKDVSANMIGMYNRLGIVLDTDKLVGGVRACLGIKEISGGRFVPNSALKADIREYISNPMRIIATYRKKLNDDVYSQVVHIAKKIDWDKVKLPSEYSYLPRPT